MLMINLANASSKHNWLLATVQLKIKRSGKPLYERLTKFITVIRSTVTGFNLYFQWCGKIVGTIVLFLPRQLVPRYLQAANAVACCSGDDEATPACSLDISNSATGSGFGAWKWGHSSGKIMRFRC